MLEQTMNSNDIQRSLGRLEGNWQSLSASKTQPKKTALPWLNG